MRHNLISKLQTRDVRYLQNLTVLDLSQNKIADITRIPSACKNLRELDLISNQLSSLPPDFYEYLKNLEQLQLSGNPVSELSEQIGELSKLRVLGISFTNIKQLPRTIVKLARLSRILVDNTPLIVALEIFLNEGIGAEAGLRQARHRGD